MRSYRFTRAEKARRSLAFVAVTSLLLGLFAVPAGAAGGSPNVGIEKTAAAASIEAGGVASFTITVSNTGTAHAVNVSITDVLPDSGLAWAENPDVAACTVADDPGGDILTCNIGTLGAGASFSVTVEATTNPEVCDYVLNNTAKLHVGDKATKMASASISVECPPVVGVPGRMTGGGSVFTEDSVRVTHGFELHCIFPAGSDPIEPNNLEINWEGNQFHLETLTQGVCTDDPGIDQHPPTAAFDTYDGAGFGRYNGVSGAFADWVLVDAGEPGTIDTFTLTVVDADGNVVLDVATANLTFGNHQAH